MKLNIPQAAQMELLHALRNIETEEELYELKLALSQSFAQKAQKELNSLWEDGTLNQQKLDEWRKQHFRTPYKS